ncbi:polyhydroxyalkanoic acid system family protein [Roseiarcaceae bacterium H3SJ34-1]|uniref:polyhydroxyalkanoic acid system family protein n=1 Tax=Terripilifer ovatus TaxID=3032367 RepID=UPI003AB95651|nr:polyhydroxyalkanoic acid system family protein [Roseiarcaceae bacterium H3SJ34-1]
MSAPLVVTIPHNLGQAEAARRLQTGIDGLGSNIGGVLNLEEKRWADNTLLFRVSAVSQVVTGNVQVLDKEVRLEVELPWLLRQIAERFLPRIRQEATILLEKPSSKA